MELQDSAGHGVLSPRTRVPHHVHIHTDTHSGAGRVLISVGCLADRTEADKPHESTILSVEFPFYKMKSVLERDGSDGCTA